MPEIVLLCVATAVLLALLVQTLLRRRAAARRRRRAVVEAWGQPLRSERSERPVARSWRAFDGDRAAIDDDTWQALELADVFTWTDRTLTAIGAAELYGWLRAQDGDGARRLALAEVLAANDDTRVALQLELARLGDRTGWQVPRLLATTPARLPVTLLACRALVLGLLGLGLAAALTQSGWLLALALLCALGTLLVHARSSGTLDGQLPALSDLGAIVQRATSLRDALPEEAVGSWLTEGLDDALGHVDGALRARSPEARAASTGTLGETLAEYGRVFLLTDVRAYLRSARALERHRAAFRVVARFVGRVDALLSLAHLTRAEAVCRTEEGDVGRLEADGVVHPLIEGAVANPIALGPRGLLVTGSNMAGKSTYLRTIGVNVALARGLGVATATRFVCPPLRVFASMGAQDDLAASVSLYQSEVLRMRELLQAGDAGDALFLLDEVFRGTNPHDRIAASGAVLLGLAERNLVVAATHDLALGELTRERFGLAHFSEHVDEGGVRFDYRLKAGPSTRTNALSLLRELRFPEAVVERAEAIARAI